MSKREQFESWGDIPASRFDAFQEQVYALESAFPTDDDGDSPIEVLVVDKRKQERLDYFPVPQSRIFSYDTHNFIDFKPDVQQKMGY